MKKTMIVAALMALVATGANAKTAADSAAISKEQACIYSGKAEPYYKHQGPEPQWYVLGLLYPQLLRERDFEEDRQDIRPQRDVRSQQDLYGPRHNGSQNAR